MISNKVASLLRVESIVVIRISDLELLYIELPTKYRLPLLTIVLLRGLRYPLAYRVRRSFPPFTILEVDSRILAVFLIGGPSLVDIKPSFPGDVICILEKVVIKGLSPCFEGF